MTVEDLINDLLKIENKNLPVTIEEDGYLGAITRVIYSKAANNSLNNDVIILR